MRSHEAIGHSASRRAVAGVLIERFGATIAVFVFSAWMLLLAVTTTFNGHVREAKLVSSNREE